MKHAISNTFAATALAGAAAFAPGAPVHAGDEEPAGPVSPTEIQLNYEVVISTENAPDWLLLGETGTGRIFADRAATDDMEPDPDFGMYNSIFAAEIGPENLKQVFAAGQVEIVDETGGAWDRVIGYLYSADRTAPPSETVVSRINPAWLGDSTILNSDALNLEPETLQGLNTQQAIGFELDIDGDGEHDETVFALVTDFNVINHCPTDFNTPENPYNGATDVHDLLHMIGSWGDPGQTDVDGNGTTDVFDLLDVLGEWGDCPNPSLD